MNIKVSRHKIHRRRIWKISVVCARMHPSALVVLRHGSVTRPAILCLFLHCTLTHRPHETETLI
jgi:hypothetical protein